MSRMDKDVGRTMHCLAWTPPFLLRFHADPFLREPQC